MPQDESEQSRWFEENLLPHEPMLRAWLQSRFSRVLDIDDVVQEAYIRVLKAHDKACVRSPKAFLFATARNYAVNAAQAAAVRGEGAVVQIEECEIFDEGAAVPEMVARNQELEMLTKAVQSLPGRCREVFTLRKVYGLSQKQIAQRLGISEHTVNAQISIGINKCTRYIELYCKRGE